MPDDIIFIGVSAFDDFPVKVKIGTKSLLSLWQAGYEPYDLERGTKLICPTLTEVSSTQTSITVKTVNLLYDGYTYIWQKIVIGMD